MGKEAFLTKASVMYRYCLNAHNRTKAAWVRVIESQQKTIEELKKKLKEVVIENENYRVILKNMIEKQISLDILDYIEKLDSKDKIDAVKISKELGYEKEIVEEVIKEIYQRLKSKGGLN